MGKLLIFFTSHIVIAGLLATFGVWLYQALTGSTGSFPLTFAVLMVLDLIAICFSVASGKYGRV